MTRLLPAAARETTPWKNGGGVTATVASAPDGVGLDGFRWRVSLAEVASAGPFSAFPGIDRHLSVLDGVLRLDVAGRTVTLAAGDEGLAFPGDAAVFGTPLGGVVTDCNVMTRRGRARAAVTPVDDGRVARPEGATLLLLALAPAVLTAGGAAYRLTPRDALLVDDQPEVAVAGRCLAITLIDTDAIRNAPDSRRRRR
ncbi:HutD family protein [Sphingomonas flavalba]|uniref:HutD/Ves family protein n=1 Tax=Sphingomonas flavalba TaxID=2559804 RepID=UPI00109DF036|nr:HutD family protein [Sphingomonas flavalba]